LPAAAPSSPSWSWPSRPPRRPSGWRSSSPSTATGRRHSSTSTTRCGDDRPARRMNYELLIPLIVALPLAGFLITAAIGKRLGKQAHWIPVGAVVLSWLAEMLVVAAALQRDEPIT